MKIGIFDSGLGGLFVMRSLAAKLPNYDYVYLGDTQRVPYGNRSEQTVYEFLEQAVDYLFKKNCELIIVACNTASAEALRKIQRRYLPKRYPARRVLGVIIPTAEAALEYPNVKRIGVLATQGTVRSNAYVRELKKINPSVKVFQHAAPLLVPLIENDGARWAKTILRAYLKPLIRHRVEIMILGCTHYPAFKKQIHAIAKKPLISQDEVIPGKLKDYLDRHPELSRRLTKKSKREFLVTDLTPAYVRLAKAWFGKNATLKKINL